MLTCALRICSKDLRLVLSRSAGLTQALLLGLLLIFLFSLSLEPGEKLSPQAASVMFWLASAFCHVLIFNMLYSLEESSHARDGLLLLPSPVQAIWLGKAIAGILILCTAQCIFIPAVFIFLGQQAGNGWVVALLGIVLGNTGMAASGSLLGALSTGQSGRESLLSLILFPLLIPLLLASVQLTAAGLLQTPDMDSTARWIELAAAFDCLFLAAGLFLFPFVYSGEN